MWKKRCMLCVRRQDDDDAASLDYRHSSLSNVPSDVFAHERTLEELFLDSNRIRDLPRELFYCQGLRYLHLSDNELVSLPSMIGLLINLERLDISKNALSELPDDISGCKALRTLEASVNPLNRVPEGLTRLITLTELFLNDAFLESLPANFGRLNQLRVLELRENRLQALPNSLSALMYLQRLDVGTNDFIQLPEVIGSLICLQELWLDNNRLTSISGVIGNLQQLTFLDASKNYIESVADEIERCLSLTDLYLSNNRLQQLPESIGRLTSLLTLKLNDNCLTSLPFSIGGLASLMELDVSCNYLKELPIGIGLLRFLQTLYADDNFLTMVPAELGSCSKLTIMSFRTNNLVCIPDELGRIPHLKVLNLCDNKLRCLPFGLIKLKELTALWLADNQTKPLLKLQTEIDRETGQRMLTCYLLPQQTIVAISDDEGSGEAENDNEISAMWNKGRRIRFESDDTLTEQSHLQRTPTPYPKELKRRLQRRRELAVTGKFNGGGSERSIDGMVRGRRSQRQSRDVTPSGGGGTRSPQMVGRHVLLKADRERLLRDKARMNSNVRTDSDTAESMSFQFGTSREQPNRISVDKANPDMPTDRDILDVDSVEPVVGSISGERSANRLTMSDPDNVDNSIMSKTDVAGDSQLLGRRSGSSHSNRRHDEGSIQRRMEETDIDAVEFSDFSNNHTGVKPSQSTASEDVVNNNANGSSYHSVTSDAVFVNQTRGIDVMSYDDFVKNLSARGQAPPRRLTVHRENGPEPRYVVHQHPHQRAQVRSLRRHGHESEDGYVTGRRNRSHGFESDNSYSNRRPRSSRRGYDSDVGCRSDVIAVRHHHRPVPSVNSSSVRRSRDAFHSDNDMRANQHINNASMNTLTFDRSIHSAIREERADFTGLVPAAAARVANKDRVSDSSRTRRQGFPSEPLNGRDSRVVYASAFEADIIKTTNAQRRPQNYRRSYEPIQL